MRFSFHVDPYLVEGQGFEEQAAALPVRSVQVHHARLERPHRHVNLNLPRNHQPPRTFVRIPVLYMISQIQPHPFSSLYKTQEFLCLHILHGMARRDGTEDWLQFGSVFFGES